MPAKFPEFVIPSPCEDSDKFSTRLGSMNGNSRNVNTITYQNLSNEAESTMSNNRAVCSDEIAISGISARLPESDNLQEFQDNLFQGVDMITDDGRRWSPGLHGLPARSGKLKELDKFDATFFGVHAKQANFMDPQLRMLLELTYEAILDAGVNPTTIRGSRTVKSNMGHSEPASGLCSIAKMVLAMQKGVIPGNLHFNKPNPDIPALNDGRFKVVAQNTPWQGGIIGVNSFGFGGANVHVILKSNPKKLPQFISNSTPVLVPFSGRTQEAVEFGLKQVSSTTRDDELIALLQGIAREDINGHAWRGYAVLHDDRSDIDVQQKTKQEKPPVWFVFSGMGSQWSGMGRDLLQFKTFETSIKKSSELLFTYGVDLYDIILNDQSFDNVLTAFVGIAAIQVGLVDMLGSLGISPDGIIGHSVGELGCAYADGCFTAEQTVLAAYARGKAILESKLPLGGMAAVGLTWEEAKVQCPADIYPACHNSKDSVSVSGPAGSIKAFVEILKEKGIFAKEVNSSGQAFHSAYIADVGPKLRESLEKIIRVPKQRSERWISSSIPESAWNSALAKSSSAAYHVNNLLSPVLFQEALAYIPENAVVIEIAPHALLQAILKRSLSSSCVSIGLLNRSSPDNSSHFLNAIGKTYNAGLHPVVSNLYRKLEFPVSISTSLISPLLQWDHSISWNVAKFDQGWPITNDLQ
ncbi:unnamed protein product [Allacma fusca]|uniref:Uncharacterized protein n=1 Tax=Allacma fusca TaxID=39272 RepID=A0A8J2L2Q3_9HEXA|nr:unnamed protein product [Allacma fusca]